MGFFYSKFDAALDTPLSMMEVEEALFRMGGLKAPGSNGFPVDFYQKHWEIVGDSVFQVVSAFFSSGSSPLHLYQTYITFIPKKKNCPPSCQ